MSIKAMKQALEALEKTRDENADYLNFKEPYHEAIIALRTAIEQAGKQDAVVFYRCNGCNHAYEQTPPTSCDCMEAGEFDRVEYYTTLPAAPVQEPWETRERFYEALDRAVENVRQEMRIKTVTMRCKDYDLALPIVDTYGGHVFVAQVGPPTAPVQEQAEQLAKLGWQAIECPFCGSSGAQAFPKPAPVQEPLQSVWDTLPSNKDVEEAMRMKRLNQLATPPAASVQEQVIDHSCKDTYELIMKWADIYAAQTGNLYAQAAQDPSKVARMADERTMLACVVAQAISQPPKPDLLNALKRIVDEPNNTMSDGKALKEIIRIARAAIAKETGEQA